MMFHQHRNHLRIKNGEMLPRHLLLPAARGACCITPCCRTCLATTRKHSRHRIVYLRAEHRMFLLNRASHLKCYAMFSRDIVDISRYATRMSASSTRARRASRAVLRIINHRHRIGGCARGKLHRINICIAYNQSAETRLFNKRHRVAAVALPP